METPHIYKNINVGAYIYIYLISSWVQGVSVIYIYVRNICMLTKYFNKFSLLR